MRTPFLILLTCFINLNLVNYIFFCLLGRASADSGVELDLRSVEEPSLPLDKFKGYRSAHSNSLLIIPSPTTSGSNASSSSSISLLSTSSTSLLSTTTSETFQLGYPYIPGSFYGEPVLSKLLLNHTFENSYGKPLSFAYSPPVDIEFNRVVLTLNNLITDYQYDRLAHLSLNGAEIWRLSTIEPYGSKTVVKSTYNKDVSYYLKLFQEESIVGFELGNIISSSLDGAPNVQIYINYYYVDTEVTPIGVGGDLIDESGEPSIFSSAKYASRVYPLTGESHESSPDVSLPSDSIHVELPNDIPRNTTRMILSIFASGNSQEEFWYSNTFLEFQNVFKDQGVELYGYGPGRLVEVFYNSQKIATQAPQPFIFTGGLSPDLWIPIVANDAFDLPSIDIDVTALLPEVWGGLGYIDILVTNGTSDSPDSIGSDWLVSANLLTFEDKTVKAGDGELLSITNTSLVSANAKLTSPEELDQSLVGSYSAAMISQVKFELKNGSMIESVIKLSTCATISNIQTLKNYSSIQTIDHIGHSQRSLEIWSLEDNVLFNQSSTYEYPLQVILSSFNDSSPDGWIATTNASVNITKHISKSDGEDVIYTSDLSQVSNSIFLETEKDGNHGDGNSTSQYSVLQYYPFQPFSYSRNAKSLYNKLISDSSIGGLV